MKRILFFLSLIIVASLLGCVNGITPESLPPTVVVQGYLYASNPIDSIVITQTAPIDQYFSDSAAHVTGALVTIGVDGRVYTLQENPVLRGVYSLPADSLMIQSGKTYSLTVHALNTIVTASTTVPDTFQITTSSPDTIQWPHDLTTLTGPPLAWTASANRDAYAISMEALDTLMYQTSPTDSVLNQHVVLPGLGNNRSTRTQQVVHYTLELLAPQTNITWDLFRWYGKHRLTVFAMDTNFVDFMVMQSVGGRSYLPQLNHITNGIGVFGSAARRQQDVFLRE